MQIKPTCLDIPAALIEFDRVSSAVDASFFTEAGISRLGRVDETHQPDEFVSAGNRLPYRNFLFKLGVNLRPSIGGKQHQF